MRTAFVLTVATGVLVAIPGWAQTRDEVREETDEAARETERAAEQGGEAIEESGEAIEESGEAVGDEAEDAGDTVRETADDAGETAAGFGESIGDTAEDAVETTQELGRDAVEVLGQRGVAVTAGLGLLGYANNETNDFIDPGAAYTARVHIGTEERVEYEIAYLGSAASIDALGLDSSAILISNAIEGNIRYNFSTDAQWQPYLVAGAAWRRYDITSADFNTSSANDADTVMEVPFGAGVTWRSGGGLLIDGRLGYRLATFEDLLGGRSGGGPALDNWHVGARAGWEF